jgi:hypothetical protein
MRFDVLDHGYVALIEPWGSDARIIESARMSTGKGFLGWGPKKLCSWCQAPEGDPNLCKVGGPHIYQDGFPGDEKLLRYLWENKHTTPFEMAGMTIEIQAPIFVFREWHRHRTQSYSELSARYTPLPDVNYLPSVERLMMNAGGSNKQAGVGVSLEDLRWWMPEQNGFVLRGVRKFPRLDRRSAGGETVKDKTEWMNDAHFQGGGECCETIILEIQRDALETAANDCELEAAEAERYSDDTRAAGAKASADRIRKRAAGLAVKP